MKTIRLLFFVTCLVASTSIFSQINSNLQTPMSINTDGSAPDPSAQLDVSATDKGMLVPRMTTAQRTAIASPATGLLVFDIDTGGFWFYNGTAWTDLSAATPNQIADTDDDTGIRTEQMPDDDRIRFRVRDNEVMLIDTSGNIGIGTSLPATKLHVRGDDEIVTLESADANSSGIGPVLLFKVQNAFNQTILSRIGLVPADAGHPHRDGALEIRLADRLNIYRGNATSFNQIGLTLLASNGYVGIGTTTPNSKFTITPWSKDVKITLYDNGSTTNHYGFGVTTNQLNYHVSETAASHVFFSGGKNGDGVELMRINGNGNLGIGTTTPTTAKLVISANPAATGIDLSTADVYAEMRVIRNSLNATDKDLYLGFGSPVGSSTRLFADGVETLTVKGQRAGIGRNPLTNKLEVEGNASKSSAGDWLANSDARLKKNISLLDSHEMLEKLLVLQGITYEWNDDQTGSGRPEGIQYGFTAQNIQTVFPTLVEEDKMGFLQTAYGTYDAMTVEAIRALAEQNLRQQAEIENLQSKLTEMEGLTSRLAKIEALLSHPSETQTQAVED